MLVADFLDALGALMGESAAWDPHGLQLGDPTDTVDRVGVCHEVTNQVIDQTAQVDLLVTYHPLLFQPLNRLVAGTGPGGRAFRLLRGGVNVAVVHTAWDTAPGGTADALAHTLGLHHLQPFGASETVTLLKLVTFVPPDQADELAEGLAAAGAGRIGDYSGCSFRSTGVGTFLPAPTATPTAGEVGVLNRVDEIRLEMVVPASRRPAVVDALRATHPYEVPAFDLYQTEAHGAGIGRIGSFTGGFDELVDRCRQTLAPDLRASGTDRQIDSVAVLPGSGGSFLAEAADRGADVIVTGDVSHHQTIDALDRGLAVIDVGHAPSERPGVDALVEAIRKIGPELVEVDVDPTPWRRR